LEKETQAQTKKMLHYPGWRIAHWSTAPTTNEARELLMNKPLREAARLVYVDIREVANEELPSFLNTASENIKALFDENKNYTLCLLGYSAQTTQVH
jgi:hypothetical protein